MVSLLRCQKLLRMHRTLTREILEKVRESKKEKMEVTYRNERAKGGENRNSTD